MFGHADCKQTFCSTTPSSPFLVVRNDAAFCDNTNMAERGYSFIECELQIKPKLGDTVLDNNLNLLQSENSDFREVLNKSSVLELQLNID